MLTYPMSTGRNFDEVLRILDSVQLTAKHQIATPVNWKPGDDVIIAPRCRTRRRRSAIQPGSVRRSPICATRRSRRGNFSTSRRGQTVPPASRFVGGQQSASRRRDLRADSRDGRLPRVRHVVRSRLPLTGRIADPRTGPIIARVLALADSTGIQQRGARRRSCAGAARRPTTACCQQAAKCNRPKRKFAIRNTALSRC